MWTSCFKSVAAELRHRTAGGHAQTVLHVSAHRSLTFGRSCWLTQVFSVVTLYPKDVGFIPNYRQCYLRRRSGNSETSSVSYRAEPHGTARVHCDHFLLLSYIVAE